MKRFALFLFSLFVVTLAMARAGGGGSYSGGGGGYHPVYHSYSSGGGGSGGGGGIDLSMIFSFIFGAIFVVLIIVVVRVIRTRRRLAKATETADPMWNVKTMKQHAMDVFHRMQTAWSRQYMDPVEDIVMPQLFNRYSEMLYLQKRQNMRNMIGFISIEKARIVDVEDSDQNNEDRFSIYIAGTMTDYMESTDMRGTKTTLGITTPQPFDDTYHFRRVGNVWMLENINNAPGRIEKMTAAMMDDQA